MDDSQAAVDAAQEAAANFIQLAGVIDSSRSRKQQREDALWYYEDQKKWTSPVNQMALRLKAGLNPYGEFQTNSVGQPQPVDTSIADSLNGLSGSIQSGLQRRIERAAQKLTYQQILLEQKRVENDTKRAEQQARLLSSQVDFQGMVNLVKSTLLGNEIQMSDAEVANLLLNNKQLSTNLSTLDQMNDATIKNLIASANQSDASSRLSQKQIDRINELLPAESKKLSAEATRAEFDSSVPIIIDELTKNLDSDKKLNSGLKAFLKVLVFILLNK